MRRKRKSTKSFVRVHLPILILGIGAVALIVGMVYATFRTTSAQAPAENAGVPVFSKRVEDAMPFPATLKPASFKRTDVKRAYQTAQEIPGVLAQQPCYCYCQRKGHRSLLDCFRTEHAATCDICIKEALLAAQLHTQGKSAEEIREAIIHGNWAHVAASTGPAGSEVNR